MNVMFNIRSSIRPSFPIHPSAYPQNLLKNSYLVVMESELYRWIFWESVGI